MPEPMLETFDLVKSFRVRRGFFAQHRMRLMANQRDFVLVLSGLKAELEQQLAEISKWYRGWINYFNMASSNRPFEYLEGYIRRRVRSRLIGDLKRRKYLARKLHKLGGGNRRTVNHVVYSNKRRWALSRTRVVHRAWSNAWFAANGFAPSNLR